MATPTVDKYDPSVALRETFNALSPLSQAVPERIPPAARARAPEPVKSAEVLARLATPAAPRFASVGEQFRAAADAAMWGQGDPRLFVAAAGQSEGIGKDGGFAVAPEFAANLLHLAYSGSMLAPLCDRRQSSRGKSGLVLPAVDETSRAAGSRLGGVLASWLAEGEPIQLSTIKFNRLTLLPKKLVVAGAATEELSEDVEGLDGHINAAFRTEGGYALDQAIVSGSGIGEPLGFLKSSALITVAKESGQMAATITKGNLKDMWRRMPVASRRRALWLVNEDAESQIVDNDDLGQIYQPAGVGGNPWPTLFGRPMIAMEQAPALGQVGDISVVDLSQYVFLDGGQKTAMSIHVKFIEGELVFRFIWRADGAPGWKTPVMSANGAMTRSPFVTLEARP